MPGILHGDPTPPATLERYARVAGVALLLSIVFGFLGEAFLPGRLVVRGDAAATANNIIQHATLFRVTFAAYLVEGICDALLAVVWYILLKPVDRNLALISAFFGMVAMITFAVAQSAFFASSVVLRETHGMTAFTLEQRQALAMLGVRLTTTIAALFLIFYGLATVIRGYLIARSGYLPRILGILFAIGGLGFIARTVTFLLAPNLSSPLLLMPMAVGGIPLTLWMLFKGVRLDKAPA